MQLQWMVLLLDAEYLQTKSCKPLHFLSIFGKQGNERFFVCFVNCNFCNFYFDYLFIDRNRLSNQQKFQDILLITQDRKYQECVILRPTLFFQHITDRKGLFANYVRNIQKGTQKKICDVLRDLVPFVQFKKCRKYPWRSVTFSSLNFAKSNTPPQVFFTIFELYKWYRIAMEV